MSQTATTPRPGAAAIALLLALMMATVAVIAGLGWSVYARERDQAQTVYGLIIRMESVIARQGVLAQNLSVLDEPALSARVYLAADSAAIAIATLQDEISRIAQRQGVAIRRVTADDNNDATAVASIGVQVQVTGTLDQVSGFLLDLETHEPIFAIPELNLNQLRTRRSAAGPSVEPSYVGMVKVRAYYKGGRDVGN